MSAPAQARRITTTGLSKISLPEMPHMPGATEIIPGKMAGMGGMGVGFGPASGGGAGGGGGGGGMPFFGFRGGGAGLVGKFFDLKQTRDGQPTNMKIVDQKWGTPREAPANREYGAEVSNFVKNDMSEISLDRFYQGANTLYITQFFVPTISSDIAPSAFATDGKVQGRRWIAVYRGKVTPPETGTYRFDGAGDDILIVRFNGRLVLDAGSNGPGPDPTDFQRKGSYKLDHMGYSTSQAWLGDTFDVRAGNTYPLEVVIGEWPGGVGAFCLLLEKIGAEYQKDSKGNPILPIFKLAPSKVMPGGANMPVFAPDTSWSVWKAQPTRPLL